MQIVVAVLMVLSYGWFFGWFLYVLFKPEDMEFYHRQMMKKEAQDASVESEEK